MSALTFGEESQITLSLPQRNLSMLVTRLFARANFNNNASKLSKILNLCHLVFLGVSCSIGSASFSIIGLVAQQAGPSVIFTYVLTGLICFLTCFPFAEFSSKIHSAGYSYSYVYSTCGEFIGYLVGLSIHFMMTFTSALIARCLSAYICGTMLLLGIHLPAFFNEIEVLGLQLCPFGALIILGLTLMMLRGMKDSTEMNTIVSMLSLATLVFAIIAGTLYLEPTKYYKDFFPNGTKGIFAAMGLSFFTYLGFEQLTCFSEEAINPDRDIPIALCLVLALALIINGSLALVMTGMAPLEIMNNSESLLSVFRFKSPGWMCAIVAVGSLSGLAASLFATLLAQPRIFYAMACDRMIPKIFMRLNKKTGVMQFSVITTGIIAATITLFLEVEALGNAVALAGLIICALVDLSVVVARYESPCSFSRYINKMCTAFYLISLIGGFLLYRGWGGYIVPSICALLLPIIILYIQKQPQINMPLFFACPCVPVFPMLGTFFFLIMAGTINIMAWMIYIIFIVIGIISYFLYGYWQSKLNPYRVQSMDNSMLMSSEINAEIIKEHESMMMEWKKPEGQEELGKWESRNI